MKIINKIIQFMFDLFKNDIIKGLKNNISALEEYNKILKKKLDYERNKEANPADVIREKLKGIKIDFNDLTKTDEEGNVTYAEITDEMLENDKNNFLASMDVLNESKGFKRLIRHLIDVQGNFTIREAQSERQRDFGIATINGIELLQDAVEALSNLHKSKSQSPEEFDEFKLF